MKADIPGHVGRTTNRSKPAMKRVTILATDDVVSSMMVNDWIGRVQSFSIETLDAPKTPHKKHMIAGSTIEQAIMKHFHALGEFDHITLKKWMKEAGYSEGSSSPGASKLVADGYLERVRKGRWKFLKAYDKGA